MTEAFILTALEAGKSILEIYNSEKYHIETKNDKSPLTSADLASNRIINKRLSILQLPILSEENKEIPYDERKSWDEFILVDPLDGTKEFIARNGEFTVNISLIRKNLPVFGVIYAPVPDILYWGGEMQGSWKLERASDYLDKKDSLIKAIKLPSESSDFTNFRVVASKSHFNNETKDFIAHLDNNAKKIQLVSRGSSLKFCMMADGAADIYPRPGPTMEWDTAAGHIIAKAAGCKIKIWNSDTELTYNKKELLNPGFIVER